MTNTRRMGPLPERQMVSGLPSWVQGLSYRAADDTIVIRVDAAHQGADFRGPLELKSEEAIALTGALLQLVDASERNRAIIDVDADPPFIDDDRDPGAPDWMLRDD